MTSKKQANERFWEAQLIADPIGNRRFRRVREKMSRSGSRGSRHNAAGLGGSGLGRELSDALSVAMAEQRDVFLAKRVGAGEVAFGDQGAFSREFFDVWSKEVTEMVGGANSVAKTIGELAAEDARESIAGWAKEYTKTEAFRTVVRELTAEACKAVAKEAVASATDDIAAAVRQAFDREREAAVRQCVSSATEGAIAEIKRRMLVPR